MRAPAPRPARRAHWNYANRSRAQLRYRAHLIGARVPRVAVYTCSERQRGTNGKRENDASESADCGANKNSERRDRGEREREREGKTLVYAPLKREPRCRCVFNYPRGGIFGRRDLSGLCAGCTYGRVRAIRIESH